MHRQKTDHPALHRQKTDHPSFKEELLGATWIIMILAVLYFVGRHVALWLVAGCPTKPF